MTTQIPAEDVFLNVRKAYRLLHDYHSMMLDVVRYVSGQFDVFETGGVASFAEDASQGYRYLRQPPWAWLPMMFYEFHFVKTLGESDWLSLSLLVISDTGFFEGEPNIADKEELSGFAAPDVSSTKFAFLLRRAHWRPLPFFQDKIQMRNFIQENGVLPDDLIAEGFVGKCYDLSLLTNEAGADKVVNDVMDVAMTHSLPLERIRPLPEPS